MIVYFLMIVYFTTQFFRERQILADDETLESGTSASSEKEIIKHRPTDNPRRKSGVSAWIARSNLKSHHRKSYLESEVGTAYPAPQRRLTVATQRTTAAPFAYRPTSTTILNDVDPRRPSIRFPNGAFI